MNFQSRPWPRNRLRDRRGRAGVSAAETGQGCLWHSGGDEQGGSRAGADDDSEAQQGGEGRYVKEEPVLVLPHIYIYIYILEREEREVDGETGRDEGRDEGREKWREMVLVTWAQ